MRILIVEDEKKLAASLQKALQAERFVVDLSFDGEDALDQAFVNEYDLIILDLGLPKLDGLEVSRRLRAQKVNSPILMLTARDAILDRVTGLDSGADDYLVKPFDYEELLARIRACLRRGSDHKESILSVGDLRLNPSTHEVKRAGQVIDLTAKEYALLEYLMRHPKQVLTKSQILDHVWDSEVDPVSNVVDVYIGYLRKKVDKTFADLSPLIHTIKGFGYRLGV